MENLYYKTYEFANPFIHLTRWEFIFYLVTTFVFGYLVHYFFSHRRDYFRTAKKQPGFYYKRNLRSAYYPNTEPFLPQTPRRIVQTETIVQEKPVYVPQKSTKDDLKKIEGIGPKIEELLNQAGIETWEALSQTKVERLQDILHKAGKRFQMHDPSTWPKQAELAYLGRWDELQEYQDFLNGGRV